MTEEEWLSGVNTVDMVRLLPSDRKRILFAVYFWKQETAADEAWYDEVDEFADQVIEGRASLPDLIDSFGGYSFPPGATPQDWAILVVSGRSITKREANEHAGLIRELVGNPFRPVTLDPRWLSSTVLDLANTIYDHRQFEKMPILSDALMDAGCDNEEIIQHCQGPGPHVRGCWVVDLLLNKR